MRNWKNWLLPILTCLTVAALSLLPPKLSALRDGRLAGTVHTEELSADSNFPARPPEIEERIWLLAQWRGLPEDLAIMGQELEGEEREQEGRRLREALADLEAILPPETAERIGEIDGVTWSWARYYLRDRTDLSSAGFTTVETYDKRGSYLAATLDVESGQIVELEIVREQGMGPIVPPEEAGRAILDHLGLTYEQVDGSDGWTIFRLEESACLFFITRSGYGLSFNFTPDWSALDETSSSAYGYVEKDAAQMQKSSAYGYVENDAAQMQKKWKFDAKKQRS